MDQVTNAETRALNSKGTNKVIYESQTKALRAYPDRHHGTPGNSASQCALPHSAAPVPHSEPHSKPCLAPLSTTDLATLHYLLGPQVFLNHYLLSGPTPRFHSGTLRFPQPLSVPLSFSQPLSSLSLSSSSLHSPTQILLISPRSLSALAPTFYCHLPSNLSVPLIVPSRGEQ